ncbi:MAG: ADP-ribosylglycohydrolase family protein [Acidobacteriota bacterium]
MKKITPLLAIMIALLAAGHSAAPAARRITLEKLEDKIRGGWAGQMIGVSYGAPTEFKSNGKIIEGELKWSPERVTNSIKQDDLYVDMTLAETMDRLGLDATTEQYGEAFKTSGYHLWHANASARKLLNRGIRAPWSGHPRYNIHANDIDFQIESDFIGLMTPGLPRESNKLCDRVGRVMNYGDGLYGGMFVCGMYTAAFFESDPRKVVEKGLACLPAKSGYARIIRDVLEWSASYPGDWKKTWQNIEEKWNRDDPCTDGALRPFNIDARLNGAYIALGLLYGRGDFSQTVEITTRCGQDSDCNPSNSAGIAGVMLGYAAIPDSWKSGIAAIADTKFDYTTSSFNDITRSTLARALKVVARAGGKTDGAEVVIPYQSPQPAKLEQWDMGIAERLVETGDSAWKWQGQWTKETGGRGMSASTAGAEATLTFSGSAVALVGAHSQEGGRADVYLDGKKMDSADAYIVERTSDNDLWHIDSLRAGQHTVRVVVRGEADPRSKGRKVILQRAIVYRAR